METPAAGKIGRLPHKIREEVCTRLLDGQTGPEVLAWLNDLPETKRLVDQSFDGEPVTPQNLSNFRLGYFRQWLARREKTEHLKTLGTFARELATSGNDISDGAAAILSGQILEALEMAGNLAVTGGSDDAESDPMSGLAKMAAAITALQNARRQARKLELEARAADRKDAELALAVEKFQAQTVEKFMAWARRPEAAEILESGKPQHVQMDLLRELMFGPVTSGKGKGAADGQG